MASPKAIVFDLDGVLLDSEPIYLGVERDLINEYLASTSTSTSTRDGPIDTSGLISKVLGRSGLQSAQIICETFSLPVSAEEFLSARDSKLAGAFAKVVPCEGALNLIDHLDALGIPISIATSSCAPLLAIKIKAQPEIFRRMKAVVCADDVPKAKPEPFLFLEAARRMGIAPEHCVVFEDAPAGVEAARRAGMRCVALRNQYVQRETYEESGDDSLIVIESGSFLDFDTSSIGLESLSLPTRMKEQDSATVHEGSEEWRTEDPYILVVEPTTKVPFLLYRRGNDGKRIKGVVYRVSGELLAEMDKFEGVDTGFYSRHCIEVRNERNGSIESAFAYFRHADGKGPEWATEWPTEKLAELPWLEEYTLEDAAGFVKREDRA